MSYEQYRPGGFGYLPVITKNMIIINVILFVATFLLQNIGIDLNRYLALHYYAAPDFKPHQFITYMFMHGSIQHIFFNMFGLFMFGQVLERYWGPKRFLIFYILTGLGAALAQYLVMYLQLSGPLASIDQQIALISDASQQAAEISRRNEALNSNIIVGASGSLMGLLGAYGLLFPNQMLYIYFLFPVKAKWFVIGYGVLELFSGISNTPGDSVAHFAHIGGLIVGVIIVLIWRRDRRNFY